MRLTKPRRKDLACVAIIIAIVTFEWCETTQVFYGQKMLEPLSYVGDGLFTAACVAAGMRGDYLPFASKQFPSLGAPFIASWNDFPTTEDFLPLIVGTLARSIGVFGAINFCLYLACIFAGLSMFYVARRFHLNRAFATMSGAMYGFTMYLCCRGTHHFGLTFYWIFPFQILTGAWLASRKGISFRSKKFVITMVVGVITGCSVIYYSFFAMQLYALALLVRMGRPKRKQALLVGLSLALVTAGSIFVMNADTIFYVSSSGLNTTAVYRDARDVELYALKPIAMLVPAGNHRWAFFRHLSDMANEQTLIQGEIPAPYFGVVQNLMLLGFVITAARAIARRKLNLSVTWALTVAWLIIGHSVGSQNSLMGLAGLRLFRSVNRVSIVILAFVLLFGAWALPRLLRRFGPRVQWVVAMVLAVFGTFEPIPVTQNPAAILHNRRLYESDKRLVEEAEAQLPVGSAVFQLPAMDFPEVGAYAGVDGYGMFRPYFFAKHLRFSHGDVKGRPNATWKFGVAKLAPPEMMAELRSKGFSSIYINLAGYPGQEQAMIDAFVNSGARLLNKSIIGDSVFLVL